MEPRSVDTDAIRLNVDPASSARWRGRLRRGAHPAPRDVARVLMLAVALLAPVGLAPSLARAESAALVSAVCTTSFTSACGASPDATPEGAAPAAGFAASADSGATAAPAPQSATEPQAADSVSARPKRSSNVVVHAGQDFAHAAKVTGIDALHVLAAPLRLNRNSAVWAVGIIGTGVAIYSLDQEIYDATQRARGNSAYDALIDVGDAIEPVGLMGRTWPFWTGLWAIGKVSRVEVMQQIPLEVLESHLIAGGIRNLGKTLLGRRRPFEHEGSHQFAFNGGTSFPSGHVSVAFEIATVLSAHAHNWPVSVASYALAGTMAVQRVDSGNHWASDCFIPAVTGTLTARTVIHRNAERRAREEGKPSATLLPYVAPNGAPGVMLTARF